MIRWLTHPYWGTAYCPKHETDGTRRCDGCDRVEPRRNGGRRSRGASSSEFAELPDGRALCLECASTAVIDTTHDAPPLYDDVCEFMASVGLPLASRPAPLARGARRAQRRRRQGGMARRPRLADPRIVSVRGTRGVRGGTHAGVGPGGFPSRGVLRAGVGFVPGIRRERHRRAVRIAGGGGGAVLAHECVHAQIRLEGGYRGSNRRWRRGLCQLVALLWVEKAASRGVAGRLGGGSGSGSGENRKTPARAGGAGAGGRRRTSRRWRGTSRIRFERTRRRCTATD